MNVGYFGKDLSMLKTNWISEYSKKEENSSLENDVTTCNLWNYELAPNKSKNIVSKHCIVSSKAIRVLNNKDKFYSETFYYHFNQ
jgi:hypothetical protein